MSSPALAKLTAYQRWELDSFDAPGRGHGTALAPTAEELCRMHQQAHDEGYAAGYGEGRDRAAQEAERLRQIVATLTQTAQELDQRLAEDLLGLALVISQQVLRQALKLRPDLILALVNEGLVQISLAQQRARLVLHPQDAALVRPALGERIQQSGLEVVEDAQMSRGGCRLEASECEVDATLERRWQRVASAIGSEHAWIE